MFIIIKMRIFSITKETTMKLAISSRGNTLESEVDPRFGRCQYFIVQDDASGEFEALNNSAKSASGGAGIQAAQTVVDSGAKVVLTGNVGPNAFQALTAGGVSVYTGASGTIKEAIERYKAGELDSTENPSVGSHFGMK
jgi:predicted Fe-Mo cluster-binding NifX family protein